MSRLQREVMSLTTHVNSEREVVGNLAMDAATLQMQLAGIRSELGCCKAESSQLLRAFRGANGVDIGPDTAYDNGVTDGAAAAVAAAAAAAAAMMSLGGEMSQGMRGSNGQGGYRQPKQRKGGAGQAATVLPEMDPAAAAALPVPADLIPLQAGSGMGMQPLMPFKAMTEARTLGVGQLMQVGLLTRLGLYFGWLFICGADDWLDDWLA